MSSNHTTVGVIINTCLSQLKLITHFVVAGIAEMGEGKESFCEQRHLDDFSISNMNVILRRTRYSVRSSSRTTEETKNESAFSYHRRLFKMFAVGNEK